MSQPLVGDHADLGPVDRLEPRAVRMALTADPLAGPDACPTRFR